MKQKYHQWSEVAEENLGRCLRSEVCNKHPNG